MVHVSDVSSPTSSLSVSNKFSSKKVLSFCVTPEKLFMLKSQMLEVNNEMACSTLPVEPQINDPIQISNPLDLCMDRIVMIMVSHSGQHSIRILKCLNRFIQ